MYDKIVEDLIRRLQSGTCPHNSVAIALTSPNQLELCQSQSFARLFTTAVLAAAKKHPDPYMQDDLGTNHEEAEKKKPW